MYKVLILTHSVCVCVCVCVFVCVCVCVCVCVYVYAGIGGRLGTGSSLGSYVRKIRAVENVELDEDPREALLKYAKVRTDTRTGESHTS